MRKKGKLAAVKSKRRAKTISCASSMARLHGEASCGGRPADDDTSVLLVQHHGEGEKEARLFNQQSQSRVRHHGPCRMHT